MICHARRTLMSNGKPTRQLATHCAESQEVRGHARCSFIRCPYCIAVLRATHRTARATEKLRTLLAEHLEQLHPAALRRDAPHELEGCVLPGTIP